MRLVKQCQPQSSLGAAESGRAKLQNEAIAIVGLGCRLPGNASSPSALWDLLDKPVDLSKPVPPSRFSAAGFYTPDAPYHGATHQSGSYFLDDKDVYNFDAPFFSIAPQEAEAMDPQHRLLLEVVYEALEDAGIPLSKASGTATAAYVGLMTADWQDLQLRDMDGAPRYLVTGGARSIASNRLSYFFNWHGPSETIDTACSSSLVAVHHAVQALRSGHATMAAAAGTNLILSPDMYILTSNLNMLSATGRGRMWSSDADGYARGEGVACVMLKTVSRALADGDHIYAVVRETGVNSDGHTTGITMPSSAAQSRLIRDTYVRAGLDVSKTGQRCQYFEAHGTGTPAGDPIEAEAIWDTFCANSQQSESSRRDGQPLIVGSVKTVLGHMEGTAGVAGIIKVALALKHARIPANLHFGTPNPKIAPFLGPGKLMVPTETIPWPAVASGPRRASLNSFGFGGTNAHAILESFDNVSSPVQETKPSSRAVTVVLSASTEAALAALTTKYANYLEVHPETDLEHLAWTTQQRRSHLAYGVSFSGKTRTTLVRQMRTAAQAWEDGGRIGTLQGNGKEHPLLGIFTGQGASWASMGAKLLEASPVFAQTMRDLERVLMAAMADDPGASKWSMTEELKAPTGPSRVGEAEFAQPLSTAVQIALVDTLRSAGIEFDHVVGHSSGEVAAAYAAGLLSAEEAIWLAYSRGRVSWMSCSPNVPISKRQESRGGMMAASMAWDEARRLCDDEELGFKGRVWVACNNSPSSVTFSGDLDSIRALQEVLREKDVAAQVLKVDKAYHSPHMRSCLDAYRSAVTNRLKPGTPPPPLLGAKRPIWVSSVHTDWLPMTADTPVEQVAVVRSPQYWIDNLLQPVRFREALDKTAGLKNMSVGVEVGPHAALRRQVADTWTRAQGAISYLGTLARGADDDESFASLVGFLWQYGVDVKFPNSNGTNPRVPLSGLPSMPWQLTRTYWRESARLAQFLRRGPADDLIGHCIERGIAYPNSDKGLDGTRLGEWRWRNIIRVDELPWLRGHKVQGQVVLPAAGYCVMAMEGARSLVDGLASTSASASASASDRLELDVIELVDVELGRAVLFSEKNMDGMDIMLRLHDIVIHGRAEGNTRLLGPASTIGGAFSILAQLPAVAEPGRANEPFLACSGRFNSTVRSSFEPISNAMPTFVRDPIYMQNIATSALYKACADVGLDYQPPFRLDSLERAFGRARSTLAKAQVSDTKSCFPVAALDNAFQTALATFSAPRDGRLLAPYLPRAIRRLRMHLAAYASMANPESGLLFEAAITPRHESEAKSDEVAANWTASIEGVLVSRQQDQQQEQRIVFQVEDLSCVSLVPSEGPYQDGIFTEEIWAPDADVALSEFALDPDSPGDEENLHAVEQLTHYYMCQVYENFTAEEANNPETEWFIKRFWQWLHHVINPGNNKPWRNPWTSDPGRVERLMRRVEPLRHLVEFQILDTVSRNILRVIRNEEGPTILEVLFKNDMLGRLYREPATYARANEYLGRVAKAISHRFPRCDIIEVGAGTGGGTRAVFNGLKGVYGSYTFTDISSGFFTQARAKFTQEIDRMTFKTLDVEQDCLEQGFAAASYDIVVASNVLHATKDIEKSLANVRKLLKPGGYLLLIEVTAVEKVLVPFLMGAVPGWWLFEDKWRSHTFSPLLSPDRWDKVLREVGFHTGAENVMSDMRTPKNHLSSVIVARATDPEWMSFRECVPTPTIKVRTNSIVVVTSKTGNDDASERVALGLQDALAKFAGRGLSTCDRHVEPPRITIMDSIDKVAASPLLANSIIVVLVDLDRPILDGISANTWEAIKSLFGRAAHDIIWVTRGRLRAADPIQNVMTGIGRCARNENHALALRFVDLNLANESVSSKSASVMALAKEVWQSTLNAPTAGWLHSSERELAIDETGRLLVPRIVPVPDANERYLARRRGLIHDEEESGSSNDDIDTPLLSPDSAGLVKLRLSYAEPLPLVPACFVSTAQTSSTGEDGSVQTLVLSSQLPQTARISPHDKKHTVMPLRLSPRYLVDKTAEAAFLWTLVQTLTVGLAFQRVLEMDKSKQNAVSAVMVVEPTEASELALTRLAQQHSKNLYVVTSRKNSQLTAPNAAVTYLHPQLSAHRAKELFARDPRGLFLDCSFLQDPSAAPVGTLGFPLPRSWTKQTRAEMAGKSFSAVLVQRALAAAADSLQEQRKKAQSAAVIDWSLPLNDQDAVAIHQQSPRRRRLLPNPKRLFRPDHTYLFAGITSDLALVMAKWMVENGAKSVALTSRKPKLPTEWLDEMAKCGATVRVFSMDVTDAGSVQSVCDQIETSMGPVAGVVFGAMALKDTLLENMSLETLQYGMNTKMLGSRLVESRFANRPLDFFVFLSSIAAIVGVRGQANYTAGNMFGRAIVASRRARGLAASSIDLSTVFSIGHLANVDNDVLDTVLTNLRGFNTPPIGVPDVLDALHEAILRGPPDASATGDVMIGPGSEEAVAGDAVPIQAAWHSDPRFGHFTARASQKLSQLSRTNKGGDAEDKTRAVRKKLDAAKTDEARLDTLTACFSAMIQETMQLPDSAAPRTDVPLMDFGIDSLVAVNLRAWFFCELQVQVPVLTILNGESVKALCRGVLSGIDFSVAS